MEETKSCLLSYVLDGNGGGRPADLATIAPDDGRFVWLHLNGRHPDAKKFLKDQMRFDPLVVKSLLAEETRPRLEEVEGAALLILRGINFNPGPAPEDLVSVRLWVSEHRIISVGRRKSRAIADMDDRLRQLRGPKTAGEFVAMLAGFLNDGIEPAIQDLEETIDRLEETSLDNPPQSMRDDLALVRKQATLFRRHMAPQRDVIIRLQNARQPWLSAADRWYLQDAQDRITRFTEDLETTRERSQILHDELTSALSGKLNRNLYMLSVITVTFMPLTFLTGLLGMNVKGIPGADHPLAFLGVCGIAVTLAFMQILLFKKLKWF